MRWRAPIAYSPGNPLSLPLRTGDLIVAESVFGVVALDARTGVERWHVAGAREPVTAGENVYVNETSDGRPVSGPIRPQALVALDRATGRERWRRASRGGRLAADEVGVATAYDRGVAFYRADGKLLWTVPRSGGGYQRVLLNDRFVVTLSERSGSISHGEIESIERANGRLIGVLPWFGKLLALDAKVATGVSDFPGGRDLNERCGAVGILQVELGRTQTPPDSGEVVLASKRSDYVLERIEPGTPNPPCVGPRSGTASAVVAGGAVVVWSGPLLGLFARGRPAQAESVVHGVSFVGGPYRNTYFVQPEEGLVALRWSGTVPKTRFLWRHPAGARFAVAGLSGRLYASDGTSTVALDPVTGHRTGTYAIGCVELHAVARVAAVDILACVHAGAREAELLALDAA